MQAKRLLGVVVGSNDPAQHLKSFEEGEAAATMIEDYGKFETCIIEVSNKGPWMLHKDGEKASVDKVCSSVKSKGKSTEKTRLDSCEAFEIFFFAGKVDECREEEESEARGCADHDEREDWGVGGTPGSLR